MKQKKRDRPVSEETRRPPDPIQSDHELFLQAFEKPTQIYRYLRTRHALSPIFLNRTASYMTGRCTRKPNTRKGFKVDSLLARGEAEHKKQQALGYKADYLNLTFCGFFDRENVECRSVEVEVILVKLSLLKRKDSSSPSSEIVIGKVTVPCNPTTLEAVSAATVSIPSENFCANGTNLAKSYCLRMRVTPSRKPSTTSGKPASTCTKDNCSSDLENHGPPPRKRMRHSPEGRLTRTNSDSRLRDKNHKKSQSDDAVYVAELVIYNKHQQCLLTAGEYEVVMEDTVSFPPSPLGRHASWEPVLDGKAALSVDIFGKCPTIKFTLSWNPSPLQSCASLQSSTMCNEIIHNNRIAGRTFDFKAAERADAATRKEAAANPHKRPKRIFYQFLFNNNARQQTEARNDFVCPWCFLRCPHLYGLLSHLRCSHARFSFTYVEHPKGGRIDVSINECYDGSYVGNPQDLHSHVGYAFNRSGPVRRTPVTMILVSRSKKPSFDLSEFQEPEADSQMSRHMIHGHNRLYFHSLTCQPIRPDEIGADSESENDPEWLRQKTQQLIDEFTDVNEGEKEVMKLWNLHIMHYNYIGDCVLPKACETFVRDCGSEIVRKNLGRNLILHLVNLCDFGLIRPEVIYRSAVQFLRLRRQMEDSADAVVVTVPPNATTGPS